MNSVSYNNLIDKYKTKTKEEIFGNRDFLGEYGRDANLIEDVSTYEDKLALWVTYYRKFPHIFVKDYLGFELKEFQIYLLYSMMSKPNFLFSGARGLGKTFIAAVAVIIIAILYPASKILIVSATKQQSYQIIVKITEIRSTLSSNRNLDYEISEFRDSVNTIKPNIEFFNGSFIKVIVGSDNARGFRANVLILDEYRMIDEVVYTTVLKRFLTTQRQPPYLNNPKYANMIERNKEIFLSSAWYRSHWSFQKLMTYYKDIARNGTDSTYSLISLPYQVSIMAGLVNKEQIKEEMLEEGFDFNAFQIEMGARWAGGLENAYYAHDKLIDCRSVVYTELTKFLKDEVDIKEFKNIPRVPNEVRIISADIALMGNTSNKNDNTVLSYMVGYPNKTGQYYIREVRYMEVISGGVQIDTHSTRIRELYEEFECDYIVLDSNGIGMQVYGDLIRDMKHPITGLPMSGFGCMNDDAMQALVQNKEADKIIFSVKASAPLNKEMYSDLQSRIVRRHLKLPIDSKQADNLFSKSKKYPVWITKELEIYNGLLSSYVETDKLIKEMINLELVDIEAIKLREKSGKRKDRFSSVAYGNYFLSTLESNLLKSNNFNWASFRASSQSSGYVRSVTY